MPSTIATNTIDSRAPDAIDTQAIRLCLVLIEQRVADARSSVSSVSPSGLLADVLLALDEIDDAVMDATSCLDAADCSNTDIDCDCDCDDIDIDIDCAIT